MHDVTILGAFLAGLLSFVSPCVLPLVPPYLAFLAGVSLDQLTGEGQTGAARAADGRRVMMTAFAFVLGFSTVFVLLGRAPPSSASSWPPTFASLVMSAAS